MRRTNIPIEITEAAAEWCGRLDDAPTAEREAFAEWLQTSPVHVAEFLRVTAVRAALRRSVQRHPEWVESLLAAPANVVHLPLPEVASRLPVAAKSRRTAWPMVAAALALSVAMMVYLNVEQATTLVIETGVGEQRFVVLEDRSTIQLNTDSHIEVAMTAAHRDVRLVRGEAMFTVVKDPSRPFRVRSSGVIAEAVGTRFSVYRSARETVVTVVEGTVVVDRIGKTPLDPRDLTPGGVRLTFGNQAIVADVASVILPVAIDIDRATAWTQRKLIFEGEVLERVVAEFNRYNCSRMHIDDVGLHDRRISGVFDANDPEAFLALLSSLEPINVREGADGERALSRAGTRVEKPAVPSAAAATP